MTQKKSVVEDVLIGDLQILHDLTLAWVETGWRHVESEPFNFKQRLHSFYDWTSLDTQYFDSFDVEQRINYSAHDYAAIWDQVIPKLKRLTNAISERPNIIISGDLAVMSVRFITSFESVDGVIDHADTLSSLVWRKSLGSWRIIREHGTGLAKPSLQQA
ncbi:hypothetical protein [Pseudomonas fluorescens]|uniref:hypothetical protein n=1 Tax=Pseudomonas fluorescens TaxID=294 RepID=UPI001912D4E4|nr:hypothetical protein [Pseudomonas fluorescens]